MRPVVLIGAAVLLVSGAAAVVRLMSPGGKAPPITSRHRGPTTLSPGDALDSTTAWHGPELNYREVRGVIRSGDTFGGVMAALGYDAVFVERLSDMMKGVYSFKRCRPGDAFTLRFDRSGELMLFSYEASPTEVYVAERGEDGAFSAYREEFEEEMKVVWVTGRIESSLYESVLASGEDPALAMIIANEVFAWDIDFYTEAQKGDVFKVAVEKHVSGDYFIKYGRIIAAEYSGGVGRKQAFFFKDPSGKDGYYNAQGVATRRVFLRSPLKYAHVTSRFGNRFHPILKKFRAHHGVDYGAATGTPVWAVADGSVVSSGVQGGLGKAVTLRHFGGYTSIYGHLSRISGGVNAGAHVRQGMVIGNVGSTGLSTGPHLHFGLLQGGKYINPLKRVAPPTEPLPAKYLAAFRESIKPWLPRFDEVPAPASPPPPAPTPAAGNTGGFNLWPGSLGPGG